MIFLDPCFKTFICVINWFLVDKVNLSYWIQPTAIFIVIFQWQVMINVFILIYRRQFFDCERSLISTEQ